MPPPLRLIPRGDLNGLYLLLDFLHKRRQCHSRNGVCLDSNGTPPVTPIDPCFFPLHFNTVYDLGHRQGSGGKVAVHLQDIQRCDTRLVILNMPHNNRQQFVLLTIQAYGASVIGPFGGIGYIFTADAGQSRALLIVERDDEWYLLPPVGLYRTGQGFITQYIQDLIGEIP